MPPSGAPPRRAASSQAAFHGAWRTRVPQEARNAGQAAEARQRCEALLAEKGPDAEAFYWLGLLADAQGQGNEAQAFYRKALYLQPDHQESLQHLAALLAAQGDTAGARRLQERAARGVKRNG